MTDRRSANVLPASRMASISRSAWLTATIAALSPVRWRIELIWYNSDTSKPLPPPWA